MQRKAFTLIELLVVVAIIAILAAIAIPNFLEAQTRAKVGRAQSDMRSIAVAIESYRTDYDNYPLSVSLYADTILPSSQRLSALTSPVAFISSIPGDVFRTTTPYSFLEKFGWVETNLYQGEAPPIQGLQIQFFEDGYSWVLSSVGPSGSRPDLTNGYGYEDMYDPTNGTSSRGSILRLGP